MDSTLCAVRFRMSVLQMGYLGIEPGDFHKGGGKKCTRRTDKLRSDGRVVCTRTRETRVELLSLPCTQFMRLARTLVEDLGHQSCCRVGPDNSIPVRLMEQTATLLAMLHKD